MPYEVPDDDELKPPRSLASGHVRHEPEESEGTTVDDLLRRWRADGA